MRYRAPEHEYVMTVDTLQFVAVNSDWYVFFFILLFGSVHFAVTAAWKEPVPGWTISKNGPQGFLMGASKGVVRRLPVAPNLVYDYIPIDVVVNQLLITAWHVNQKR